MPKSNYKAQASSSRLGSASFGSPFASSAAWGAGAAEEPISSLSFVYTPPDLSHLADASTVVAFKNLQKKASATKAKALDDLLSHASAPDAALQDAFVSTWILLYPRASIDNDRRVRQNAHALQGQVALAAGKRMARHMPAVVGAWLCGLHANDKLVIRSAEESISLTFATKEKRAGVWKAYQTAILDFCRNSICKETPQTLSDLSNTSPDDVQAKYARVVGAALLTLSRALRKYFLPRLTCILIFSQKSLA